MDLKRTLRITLCSERVPGWLLTLLVAACWLLDLEHDVNVDRD